MIFVAVFMFIVYFIIRKRDKIKWFLKPLVLFIAAAAFSQSSFGGWIGGMLSTVLRFPAGWFSTSAAVMATAVLILLLLITYLDLRDKKVDKPATAALVLMPLLAVIAIGPVANAVNGVTHGVADFGSNGVSTVTHG